MSTQSISHPLERHAGPPLWILAVLYAVLFNAGLYPVTIFSGHGNWPPPLGPVAPIVSYFQTHTGAVLTCLFLQSGALLCFGLFTANTVSRMYFLGVRSAGLWIALLGGFLATFDSLAGGFLGWAMIRPAMLSSTPAFLALFYTAFAFGGPGFSVPMGLFMAGVSIPALLMKLIPRWLAVIGLVLAAAGVLSWFFLIEPRLIFLIPLTRFPGFLWLIAVGVTLPGKRGIAARSMAA